MPKFAILMQGTLREATFLCQILPYVVGDHDYDLYLCIRQTEPGDLSRTLLPENEFSYKEMHLALNDNVFLCVLPPYERDVILREFVLPVGPTDVETEVQCISMFMGIFAGVKQLKNAGRSYDYIIRTRTDYLFWDAPLFEAGVKIHKETGGKILVDPQRTCSFRYQDKPYLPWQGSISDLFSFSSQEQFFRLWDFEERLAAMWTGITETTLFRNALFTLTGESVQHPRKSESFLSQYFHIIPGEFKQSPYYFRHGVLSSNAKSGLLSIIKDSNLAPRQNLSLVWSTYKFLQHPGPEEEKHVFSVLGEFKSPEKQGLVSELMERRP